VSDVEFIGHNLYALLQGAGCSHGVPSVLKDVVKIHADGSWSMRKFNTCHNAHVAKIAGPVFYLFKFTFLANSPPGVITTGVIIVALWGC
jgi:hypothetical protein